MGYSLSDSRHHGAIQICQSQRFGECDLGGGPEPYLLCAVRGCYCQWELAELIRVVALLVSSLYIFDRIWEATGAVLGVLDLLVSEKKGCN